MANDKVVEYVERELKFDVAADWPLPDLTTLTPEHGTVTAETVHLTTTYFDTASRDLLATGVTLRRRLGDVDTGWQLKIPDSHARLEIRAELNGTGIPKSLRDLVHGIRTGEPLKALATLSTERTMHGILDADGTRLAEIADDHVTATVFGPRRSTTRWREIEVELAAGDERLLGRAGHELTRAGAQPATAASKLARALQGPGGIRQPDLSLTGLIRQYLTAQIDTLLLNDLAWRRNADEVPSGVVHGSRVAIRRIRSVLKTFGDLFDPQRVEALNEELAWYGGVLGALRDCEVLQVHLDEAVRSLPDALVIGPVTERIHTMLAARREAATAAVAKAMASQRYLALARALKLWRDEPAFAAGLDADDAVARRVRAATAQISTRMRNAARHPHQDEALHQVRKAAKRARYVAELAEPRLGKKARAAVRRAKSVQELLGGVQDGAIASEFLQRAAREADATPGESSFTFGILYAREQPKPRALARSVGKILR